MDKKERVIREQAEQINQLIAEKDYYKMLSNKFVKCISVLLDAIGSAYDN